MNEELQALLEEYQARTANTLLRINQLSPPPDYLSDSLLASFFFLDALLNPDGGGGGGVGDTVQVSNFPANLARTEELQEISDRLGDTPADGVTPPAGGTGLLRWISGIYQFINSRLPVSLGQKTKEASLSVTVASDEQIILANNIDNKLFVDGTLQLTQRASSTKSTTTLETVIPAEAGLRIELFGLAVVNNVATEQTCIFFSGDSTEVYRCTLTSKGDERGFLLGDFPVRTLGVGEPLRVTFSASTSATIQLVNYRMVA